MAHPFGTATNTSRPLPPPLDFPYPPCSICGQECLLDSGFYCPACDAQWPSEGAPEGDWEDPGATRCPSMIRPWAHDSDYPSLAHEIFQCVLDAGHIEAERGADRHRHPEFWDGWSGEGAGAPC